MLYSYFLFMDWVGAIVIVAAATAIAVTLHL